MDTLPEREAAIAEKYKAAQQQREAQAKEQARQEAATEYTKAAKFWGLPNDPETAARYADDYTTQKEGKTT